MIDLKKVRPCKNGYVDGEFEDGKLVEFKTNIPRKYDNLIRQVVAMANTVGGFIIFGVDEKTLSIVGIGGDYTILISDLELSIRKLSLGIYYQITHEVVDDKDIVILEIKKSSSTTYFSRVETTPARQIAYRYTGKVQDGFSISKEEMRYTKGFKCMTMEAFLTSRYCGTWRFLNQVNGMTNLSRGFIALTMLFLLQEVILHNYLRLV